MTSMTQSKRTTLTNQQKHPIGDANYHLIAIQDSLLTKFEEFRKHRNYLMSNQLITELLPVRLSDQKY